MPLADGKYTLHASPARGLGGLFATGHNEVDGPVTTTPLLPETIGRQIWEVKATGARKDVYTITLWTSGSTFGGVFSPKIVQPGGPIITSQTVTEWIIFPVENGLPGAYRISLPIIGVEYLVGTEGNDVVLKEFPINHFAADADKPYWKFHEIEGQNDL